ncbi:hypothetical protein F5Y18DRAFT_405433 [Xylariaceae sp. FL1019]|nr:hypothetical protein F5Y18DRAFT_405433 [Xylariaceae sp. FL1019]
MSNRLASAQWSEDLYYWAMENLSRTQVPYSEKATLKHDIACFPDGLRSSRLVIILSCHLLLDHDIVHMRGAPASWVTISFMNLYMTMYLIALSSRLNYRRTTYCIQSNLPTMHNVACVALDLCPGHPFCNLTTHGLLRKLLGNKAWFRVKPAQYMPSHFIPPFPTCLNTWIKVSLCCAECRATVTCLLVQDAQTPRNATGSLYILYAVRLVYIVSCAPCKD